MIRKMETIISPFGCLYYSNISSKKKYSKSCILGVDMLYFCMGGRWRDRFPRLKHRRNESCKKAFLLRHQEGSVGRKQK
jgi:hypothetical protein